MRAIQTTTWGQPPTFTTDTSNPPEPADNEVRIKVLASGLHMLTRSQAMGTHYSAQSLPLPYTPGIDGVGETPDGQLIYFTALSRTVGGAWAEHINVAKTAIFPFKEGADPAQVAGLLNPGMSSWMALHSRVSDLPKDFTIVILGVTTQSGRVAARFARRLGARTVIGVGRDAKKMDGLGLDQAIVLAEDSKTTDWSKMRHDVDVILDYLYGPVVVAALAALRSRNPVQYVNVGTMAGVETAFPSALLRSKNLTMRGSGPGSWRAEEFAAQIPDLLVAVQELPHEAGIVKRKLSEFKEAWEDGKGRSVFMPQEE